MRVSVVAFLFVIAGACALPEQQIEPKNERVITNEIRRAIEQIRRGIREAGLDPLHIENKYFGTWMGPFFHIEGLIDQLTFTGASNIVIDQLSYNIFQNNVSFTFTIPELRLSMTNESVITTQKFGMRESYHFSGSLIINQVRVVGDIRAFAGKVTGVSLQFSLGEIESNLRLNAAGNDYTDELNQLLGTTIPETLNLYRVQINWVCTFKNRSGYPETNSVKI